MTELQGDELISKTEAIRGILEANQEAFHNVNAVVLACFVALVAVAFMVTMKAIRRGY